MPSIFVWKASTPNLSKKSMRCYSGSNWVVEDMDDSSRSVTFIRQIVIPGLDNNSVITFLAKTMPHDWVGSELLEVHHIPYELLRSDAYGTLEHIGNWMRMIVYKEGLETEFTRENLLTEWNKIQQWLNTPTTATRSGPSFPRREHAKKPYPTHPTPGPPIPIPSISVGESHTIDPYQVQQNFQEFYAKFGTIAPLAPSRHPRGRPRPLRN